MEMTDNFKIVPQKQIFDFEFQNKFSLCVCIVFFIWNSLSFFCQDGSLSVHPDLAIALVEFSPDKLNLAVVCYYINESLMLYK